MKSHSQYIGHANVYENSADVGELNGFKSPYLALSSLELGIRDVYAICVYVPFKKLDIHRKTDLDLSLFSTLLREHTTI